MWILVSKMVYVENDRFDFVLLPAVDQSGDTHLPCGPLTLTWFIPDFDVGSGGHTTIFRTICLLQRMGCMSNIVMIPPTKYSSNAQMEHVVRKNFMREFSGKFFLWGEKIPESNALIATSWETAYYVAATPVEGRRFYFVQDYEPLFFPAGSRAVFAENSYRLGLSCICASPWLARLMREKYGARAGSFLLGYSPEQYGNLGRPRKSKTILFYARHLTPRRGFELGVLALALVKKADPEVEIILFGANAYPDLPFSCHCRGVLNHQELLEMYNEATVGLVISLTNYSLIPNEMMACGLPVVDLDTECLRDLYESGTDIILASPTPRAMADAIISLLGNPGLRSRIAENARRKVMDLTWEKTAACIHDLIRTL
jgi:glycosyltransferase involved in cell wall biosynthesis